MGEKRNRKKLAKQHNNSRKYAEKVKATETKSRGERSLEEAESYREKKIRWTAREMNPVTNRHDGIRWDLSEKETIELFNFLETLSGKTWKDCEEELSRGHKRNHYHDIADLAVFAQKLALQFDDHEEKVFRFRINGKCRLWGFRSEDLFRILWYDPDHKVYPVEKRHT